MSASSQLQALFKWISAFNAMDLHAVGELITDDYTHNIHPDSIKWPAHSSKEEYLAFIGPILAMFTTLEFTLKETVEDPEKGKIAVHLSSAGMSATGAPYTNEYILIVQFREDRGGGPKISAVKEFVDSEFTSTFFAAERERIEKSGTVSAAFSIPT